MKISLNINGKDRTVDAGEATPLLWVIRVELGLEGTKLGCATARCRACTVLADSDAIRSCAVPVSAVTGRKITTIEGLASTPQARLQQAWVDEKVSQCRYCQSGILMAAAALLKNRPQPSNLDIDTALTNICRCGTYPRARRAIRRTAGAEPADGIRVAQTGGATEDHNSRATEQ